jgi:hypothetical protein
MYAVSESGGNGTGVQDGYVLLTGVGRALYAHPQCVDAILKRLLYNPST